MNKKKDRYNNNTNRNNRNKTLTTIADSNKNHNSMLKMIIKMKDNKQHNKDIERTNAI